MISRILLTSAAVCAVSHAAPVRSGKAAVELIAASTTYQAGKPVEVAVRMKMDREWHTYWSNPGEGGMKISVKWTLPAGWTAGEPAFPVPKSFHTGGLAGYGYEGTVVFPITLMPPAEFTGEAKPVANVSWLTCNDDACVPGKAELSLGFTPGPAAATGDESAIRQAIASIPAAVDGLTLKVAEKDQLLELTVDAAATFDLAAAKVFPETEQAVAPAEKIVFAKNGEVWKATVKKNEYASGPLKKLTLVIAGAGAPAQVTWVAEKS